MAVGKRNFSDIVESIQLERLKYDVKKIGNIIAWQRRAVHMARKEIIPSDIQALEILAAILLELKIPHVKAPAPDENNSVEFRHPALYRAFMGISAERLMGSRIIGSSVRFAHVINILTPDASDVERMFMLQQGLGAMGIQAYAQPMVTNTSLPWITANETELQVPLVSNPQYMQELGWLSSYDPPLVFTCMPGLSRKKG